MAKKAKKANPFAKGKGKVTKGKAKKANPFAKGKKK